jgi:hypothetical protein
MNTSEHVNLPTSSLPPGTSSPNRYPRRQSHATSRNVAHHTGQQRASSLTCAGAAGSAPPYRPGPPVPSLSTAPRSACPAASAPRSTCSCGHHVLVLRMCYCRTTAKSCVVGHNCHMWYSDCMTSFPQAHHTARWDKHHAAACDSTVDTHSLVEAHVDRHPTQPVAHVGQHGRQLAPARRGDQLVHLHTTYV